MMRLAVALWVLAVASAAAAPAMAQQPFLTIPLDCTLGVDCYVNDYVDQDPGTGARDYMCGPVTRDTHRGVDFAVFTDRAMHNGVNVLAAAPGTVRGIRDEMPDIYVTAPNAPDLAGRDCGNGVAIDHGGGWTSQYCHMKLGSITVASGERVRSGTLLGLVGQSGATSYPHVHFTLFHKGQAVDPFDINAPNACGADHAKGLWVDDIPYRPGGFIRAGFADTPPTHADIKAGQDSMTTLPPHAPAMIAWVHGFSLQPGDEFGATIQSPTGRTLVSTTKMLDRGTKLGMRFIGKNRRNRAWRVGEYIATFTLHRGGVLVDQVTVKTVVE